MNKIYSEERWDEDDACAECGESLLGNESKVYGLCNDCHAEVSSLKTGGRVARPTVTVLPPK